MDCNCIFHDGKTKACAAEFAAAALVNAVEAFEEMIQMLRFYASAIVAD